VPTVIAALMWGFLYGTDFGPFADIANKLGTVAAELPRREHDAVVDRERLDMDVTGYNMIIFYAALRAIPAELYEAPRSTGRARSARRVHQAAAAAPGDPAVHDLLGDRLLPAVRRAARVL
jgi:multiple sugar transport system permease protein